MNTLIRPHLPIGSEPSRDDDPTGVRALLSSLPEPDPMPKHLVERINASLAAEQAQRATKIPDTSVTPLLRRRRRPARLLLAAAGVAALALVAVYSSNLLMTTQSTVSGAASLAGKEAPREATGGAPPSVADKAIGGPATTGALIEIGMSGTRYTSADFVRRAQTLRRSALSAVQGRPPSPSGNGPASTDAGLRECLVAVGAQRAQVVRADVAFYEGRPALVIVAITDDVPMAYAVGPQCSRTAPALLRPPTPLP